MHEVKGLLGICESHDPTDVDRVHLKTLVRQLKKRNETLQHQHSEMYRMMGDSRETNKMLYDEQLQNEVDALKAEVESLK